MKKAIGVAAVAAALMNSATAKAAVTLMDNNDWKVTMNGFIEADAINDSTRSLGEIIGNGAVARPGTFAGDNGRTQFSGRNSRLGFAVYAPVEDGWKSKGVFELDFFGYDPAVSTSAPKNSEASFYQNATPRVRHAYLSTEKDGWQFTAGQTWTLFGWQPYYFPVTISIAPAPGELFQRNMQFAAMKTMSLGDSSTLQAAVSFERPSQRDSEMPNLNAGVRYALNSYKSAYASTYGDIKQESASVGVSGTFRQFETPTSATDTSSQNHKNASAIAVDALIPVVPVAGDELGNSLTLGFEFSSGNGYADTLPNWTGGLNGFPQGGAGTVSGNTTLDAGYGGFNSSGAFDLVQLQTWNVSLQYVLPASWKSFMTIGYANISSTNVGDFVASATAASDIYDRSSMYFINFVHDVSKQIRVAAEFNKTQTHYFSDGADPFNNRVQLTALFRF